MNVRTFNNSFEQALLSFPHQEHVVPFKGWQTAPLFDYATQYEHELEQMNTMASSKGLQLREFDWPFELFRLALTETAIPWYDDKVNRVIGKGRYITHYIASRTAGEPVVAVAIHEMWDEDHSWRTRPRFNFLIDQIGVLVDDTETFQFSFCTYVDHKWKLMSSEQKAAYEKLVGSSIASLATFILDAMSPTTHIAKVCPAQEHRSVEWVMARTHYTLITHGHPANRKEVLEGQRVTSDAQGEITRMAHNRRGHFRTYRHARYTYARGQRRFVRAAWVGPKEWANEGGKQIYKILEPAA